MMSTQSLHMLVKASWTKAALRFGVTHGAANGMNSEEALNGGCFLLDQAHATLAAQLLEM